MTRKPQLKNLKIKEGCVRQYRGIVIGAGIAGCSVACSLKRLFPGLEITIIDQHPDVFGEASRYNSGVVHSGIHQRAEFLKSRLAPVGGRLLIEFCERNNVPHRRSGMLITVSSRHFLKLLAEIGSLTKLYKNSRRLGLKLSVLTQGGIARLEPSVRAAFGLYLPDVLVVDQPALGRQLRRVCEQEGVEFLLNETVTSITRHRGVYEIRTRHLSPGPVAELVVNAAGVNADSISRMAGFSAYTIYPYRGEYYEVIGPKKDLLSNTLVYPALPPGHPVKGIHLTKTMDGRLLIGPNAKPWKSRQNYPEVRTPPRDFLEGARRFLPGLVENDLRWAYAGLRAKINPGTREDDFVIRFESGSPTFVNLIGIESPGFTAGLAIGDYVAKWIKELCLIR